MSLNQNELNIEQEYLEQTLKVLRRLIGDDASSIEKDQSYYLTEDDIAAYVATGESMDKAGAYGIQGYGALLVERIEGCYNNVVGLPLQLVAKGLRNWGINLYEYKEVQT